jgi:acyl-CoA thioester hydrolase
MDAPRIYSTAVLPEWIDYNGHLRDAYYGLVLSYACDALMDHLGTDAAYRQQTHCTLYTLEEHLHFLHEVTQSDTVDVSVRLLAADHKRLHAAFDFYCARYPDPVAMGELMLLHVQQGASPKAVAFPPQISAAIESLLSATAGIAPPGPTSRRLELRPR